MSGSLLPEHELQLDNGCPYYSGQVWISADNPGDFLICKNHDGVANGTVLFDLEHGGVVPEKFYLKAKSTIAGAMTSKIQLNYGLYDADPQKVKVWVRDNVKLNVIKKLGDPGYFWAARGYIMDNNTELFYDKKAYGSLNMNITVLRREVTSMTALETFYGSREETIDEVMTNHSGSSVIVNGAFSWKEESIGGGFDMTSMSRGRLISKGVESKASDPSSPSWTQPMNQRAYVGQAAGGQIITGVGDAPAVGLSEALGGLIKGPIVNPVGTAFQQVGLAPVGRLGVIFTMTCTNGTFGKTNEARVQCGVDAIASGASKDNICIFDGGTSVALAHKGSDGYLVKDDAGAKHGTIGGFVGYRINTYMLLKATKPRP